MNRRAFLASLAGAAAYPLPASGQNAERMRRIGVLTAFGEQDPLSEAWLAAFRKGLGERNWRAGQNVEIDYRWSAGDAEKLRVFARELVALGPDALFAIATPSAAALLRETHLLPIVFAQVSDPVGSGLVASLARPGGNVTGFTNINIEASIGGKWLELAKEIAPSVRRVGIIYNPPTAPFAAYYIRAFEEAGRINAVQTITKAVLTERDIAFAFDEMAREPGGAVVVLPDTFTGQHRDQIVLLAAYYRLPTVYPLRWFTEIGGLLSYGIDSDDMFRRAADYIDRILKGTKPADLPVQAPSRYELTINMKTANALALTVPSTLLAIADAVIE